MSLLQMEKVVLLRTGVVILGVCFQEVIVAVLWIKVPPMG